MIQIVEYSQTEAGLAILAERYRGAVYDVANADGMSAARKARADIKGYRVSLEKVRTEIKAPALERCRLIDAEAKRITTALLGLEEPIDGQIKAEENRVDAERQAKVRAEAEAMVKAEAARRAEEERKLAAERAELALRRAELEAEQRAAAAAEAESRRRIETAERASRERIEAEAREARLRQQAIDDVARQKRQAEEERLVSERREAELAAIALRAENERLRRAQEDAARARMLGEQRRLRGWEILRNFVSEYGETPGFVLVALAISKHLAHVQSDTTNAESVQT